MQAFIYFLSLESFETENIFIKEIFTNAFTMEFSSQINY